MYTGTAHWIDYKGLLLEVIETTKGYTANAYEPVMNFMLIQTDERLDAYKKLLTKQKPDTKLAGTEILVSNFGTSQSVNKIPQKVLEFYRPKATVMKLRDIERPPDME